MKALSFKQPWASFVAIGRKTIETRTWATKYRGKLLIVASKTLDKNCPHKGLFNLKLPFGKAVAIVNLIDCRPMRKEHEKAAMCDYSPNRYAWILSDIKPIKPSPVKGMLGLFEVDYKESP